MMIKKFAKFLKNLCICIVKDDFPGMAGEMAFNFVLAFFPFVIFLVAIFGLIGTENQIDQIISSMGGIVPFEVMNIVENVLKQVKISSSGGLLTVGFFVSMIAASNAASVMIKGINRAFNVLETRPLWYTKGLSLLIVLMNAMILFIGVNFIIFGKMIILLIANFIHIPFVLIDTVLFVRWPIAFLAIYTMALLNYYFMPNVAGSSRARLLSTLPGSLFFCVFWLLASWAFSLYVDNFGTYNKVYGTLGGFAVLLLWLYYSSLIILIGGEINSQIYKKLSSEANGC